LFVSLVIFASALSVGAVAVLQVASGNAISVVVGIINGLPALYTAYVAQKVMSGVPDLYDELMGMSKTGFKWCSGQAVLINILGQAGLRGGGIDVSTLALLVWGGLDVLIWLLVKARAGKFGWKPETVVVADVIGDTHHPVGEQAPSATDTASVRENHQ
jgi:hypothetical protein